MKFKKILVVLLSILILLSVFCFSTFAEDPLIEGGEMWYEFIPDSFDSDDIDFLYNNILNSFHDENSNKLYITYNGYRLNLVNYDGDVLSLLDPYTNAIYEAELWEFYSHETTRIYINYAYYNYVEQLYGTDLASNFKQLSYENNSVLGVFSRIPSFLVEFLSGLSSIFWNDGLTFLGYLSVAALAVALFLLLFPVVRNFVVFRG